MNQEQKDSSPQPNSVHPVCKNAPNPEKCEQFAEKLEEVNSSLKINDDVLSNVRAENLDNPS